MLVLYYTLKKHFYNAILKYSKIKRVLWEYKKKIIEQKQSIKEDKFKIKQAEKKYKPAFGKFVLILLFINFTILELFTGWVTISSFQLAYATGTSPDFSPLITLLGAVLGETLSYGIYCMKAKAENTKNGIVYETTMKNIDDNGVG